MKALLSSLPVLLACLVGGTAHAHAIIMDSAPAAGSTVRPGKASVALHFNSRIDRARSRVTLVGADGTETRMPIADSGPPDVIDGSAELKPGGYTLRWQVLAVDGHITRGDIPFSVQAP